VFLVSALSRRDKDLIISPMLTLGEAFHKGTVVSIPRFDGGLPYNVLCLFALPQPALPCLAQIPTTAAGPHGHHCTDNGTNQDELVRGSGAHTLEEFMVQPCLLQSAMAEPKHAWPRGQVPWLDACQRRT